MTRSRAELLPGPASRRALTAGGRFRRLRIGMVAPVWFPVPPQGYGGIERVVSLLAEGLVAAGHDVTLFAAAGSRTSARLVTPLPAPPAFDDTDAVAGDIFHTTVAYLRADEFDVIHDHTGLGPALGAMLGSGPPVVHTLHGPWTGLSRRFLRLVHDRVHLVAISEAQRATNRDVRYAGVVHNGVDLAAHPLQTTKDDFALFVGRINPEKGPEVAVDVARRAGLPLVMVVKRSERAEQAYWDDVVAPRLRGDEIVLEQPPHDVKVDLLGRARALLFPINWEEPFGLVMVEAMACGTPVIARPCGAATEVIAHGTTGFLCRDAAEMVDALDAARDLSPVACRAHVEASFSAASMVAGYERVYWRAVADSRHRVAHSAAASLSRVG